MSALACSSSAGLSWTRKVWPQWIGSHEVSGSWLRDRSSRHMRKCRESWECLDWRRERSGRIFLLDIWDNMKKAEPLLRYQQDERQWAHTQAQEILSEIRKHFFIVRLAKHWHRFPREAVDSPEESLWRYSKVMRTWCWVKCSSWPCLKKGGRE